MMKVLAKAAMGAALVFSLSQSVVEAAFAGPAPATANRPKKSLGVSVAPVPPGAKGVLRLDRDRGMVIVNVVPGAAADQAGLRKGDVLLSINGRLINRESDLAAAPEWRCTNGSDDCANIKARQNTRRRNRLLISKRLNAAGRLS
jgi:S1-C subfamily serine protease